MFIVLANLFHYYYCNAVTWGTDISKPSLKISLYFNLSSRGCISSSDKHEVLVGHQWWSKNAAEVVPPFDRKYVSYDQIMTGGLDQAEMKL